MSVWIEKRLGEVLDLFDSRRIPLSSLERESIQGSYPYYGASGIIDSINKYIFDGEYLLIAEDGENLNSRKLPIAFWARGKFWVNNHAHIVLGKQGQAHTDFVRYCFASADISGFVTGTAQPKLSQANLKKITFRFPSFSVQEKIAAILSAYDELIENNKRRIALLEKMAEEIYREWFVRLRFPGHEKVKFVKGVPEHWTSVPSNKVFHVMSGGTPNTDNPAFWDGDIPFFTPKDAGDNFYILKTERTITQKGLDSCNSRLYKKDTIFITARGTVGKICLVHRDMAMNQTCYALSPKDEEAVYFYFLSMKNAISYIKGISKSGVFDNIIVDTFKIVPILLPPPQLIVQFNDFAAPIFNQIGALLESNELLLKTRDALLPRLISGKLSVENLDIQFPPGMADEMNAEPTAASS